MGANPSVAADQSSPLAKLDLSVSAGEVLALRLPPGYEPSGAVWLPGARRLVVVDDEGTVSEFDLDSGDGVHWTVGGDLEAVSVDPADETRVYLGVERPEAIWRFDRDSGKVVARCNLDVLRPTGRAAKKSGIEGLAFVPGPNDRSGGLFWVGVQADGTIHQLRVRWTEDGGCQVASVGAFTPVPDRGDLADLAWDGWDNRVFALYDRADRLVALDRDGRVVAERPVPGDSQEGIAVLPCSVVIVDDATGRITRYPFPRLGGCQDSE